jgi:glycerol uptake facilitator-like aquaporin
MLRRLLAEFTGSALLAAVVIGSGILGAQLAEGDMAVALLANTAATGAILYVLVAVLGPVSGAHFNPAVTLAMAAWRRTSVGAALFYVPTQVIGCAAGAVLAHAMFALPLVQAATTVREGLWLSEGAATFTLVLAIFGAARFKPESLPAVVALTVCAGYWWTPSTSFANPAITLARTLSDTFAGVRLADAPAFIAAQFGAAALAAGFARVLFGKP